MAANIDQFSRGRFVFGVGVGWSEPEFAALGVPFGQRGAITDEYLAVIKELWTGEVASVNGRFVSFREVWTGPGPVRRPHPPIWVGGSSAAAIRRAARFGDLDEDRRRTGVGSLPQVLRDLDELAALGSEYGLLDTYRGLPEDYRPAEEDWHMLEAVAAHRQGSMGAC
jgi:hypothetical protein